MKLTFLMFSWAAETLKYDKLLPLKWFASDTSHLCSSLSIYMFSANDVNNAN